jgi:ribulose-5-phosphate 4-epimerase/fuculose-1-phosphate aldolase
LILVNAIGQVVEGKHPVNIAAFAIHSSIHRARPDVVAAAHSHSLYGKAWASLGLPLEPITQDACAFFEDHVVFADFTGVVYETSEGERIAKELRNCKAAILQNHGLLTVGQTVDEAAWWFIAMDRSCHAQMLAQAAGKPVLITRERALATRQLVGTHEAGWFQFQPIVGDDHAGTEGFT